MLHMWKQVTCQRQNGGKDVATQSTKQVKMFIWRATHTILACIRTFGKEELPKILIAHDVDVVVNMYCMYCGNALQSKKCVE